MATDARIAVGLPNHPKTKKLIKRLGQASAWNLVCLILWAAENRSDGTLSNMSVEDIEISANWTGEDGAFVAALVDVHFLDDEDGEFVLHDWHEHNPWAAGADMRSEKARWNALVKHHGRAEAARIMPEYVSKHAALKPEASAKQSGGTDDACVQHARSMHAAETSTAPSPSPSPSPSKENKPARAARNPPPDCPPDVNCQVWADWLSLRNDKRAKVTYTVIQGAREEAKKAGMTFEDFLRVWCRRGSQGLEAAWLKPHERASPNQASANKYAGASAAIWEDEVTDV